MTPVPWVPSREQLAASLTAPLTRWPDCVRSGQIEALLDAADPQGVRPLLVERLLTLEPSPLDAATRRALLDRALREDAHEVIAAAQLTRVLAALADAGVPCLVFKGAATAHTLYARSALRPRDDSDLLIDPAHRRTADEALHKLGYACVPCNDRDVVMRQALYRLRDRAGVLHNLDVHWSITNRQRQFDALSPRALRLRARSLPALGASALVPREDDALLVACLHLSAHHAGSPRLIWVYEIACMLNRLNDDQLRAQLERAQLLGLAGPLASAAALAGAYFMCRRPALSQLAASAESLSPRRWRVWLDDLRALRGAPARVRYLSAHAFPSARYLRNQPGAQGHSLAWLYLRRLGRGLRHLGTT